MSRFINTTLASLIAFGAISPESAKAQEGIVNSGFEDFVLTNGEVDPIINWNLREMGVTEGMELIKSIEAGRPVIPSTVAIVDSGYNEVYWREELRPPLEAWSTSILDPTQAYNHGIAVAHTLTAGTGESSALSNPVCPAERCNFITVQTSTSPFANKGFDNPSGQHVTNYSDIWEAIERSTEYIHGVEGDNVVDVVNLSIGGSYDAANLKNAVRRAQDRGILLVAGLDNKGVENCNFFPAGYEGVLAVNSMGHTSDNPMDWDNLDIRISAFADWCRAKTNKGELITAPGENIVGPRFNENFEPEVAYWSGNSLAAPQVSALIGILTSFLKTMGVDSLEARSMAKTALVETSWIPDYISLEESVRWGVGMPYLPAAVEYLVDFYDFYEGVVEKRLYFPVVVNGEEIVISIPSIH